MTSDEAKRQNPQDPPNAGARSWSVAVGAFAAQMCVQPQAVLLYETFV